MTVGPWAVISHAGRDHHGKNRWVCQCVCGVIETRTQGALKGEGSALACVHMPRPDWIGSWHGLLRVVGPAGDGGRRHQRRWLCRCVCGGETVASTNDLLRDRGVKSCGCLRKPLVGEKFWDKVVRVPSGCWEWTGAKTKRGYGYMLSGGRHLALHRLVFSLYCAEPGDLMVCHHCDNPPCCRPDHLFLGTNQDNIDDMVAKRRHAFGERNGGGGKLTEDDAREVRSKFQPRVVTLKMLAAEYGVSVGMIRHILAGANWAHVA